MVDDGRACGSRVETQQIDALQRAHARATAGLLALEVMHEIRNPLEALGYLTYLALEEADKPEQVRKYMRLAEEQMATLNHIASQTLSLAGPAQSPKVTDLVELAEAAVRIHQRTIDSKSIHLVKSLSRDMIAEVHTGQILQVISNLIANAVDALPAEGTLHLRLRKHANQVHVIIADNGHGIPVEHLEKIFDPFFTANKVSGTGLGLALSKRIIDHHQGRIRMRSSVRQGKSGTTFKVSLPVTG